MCTNVFLLSCVFREADHRKGYSPCQLSCHVSSGGVHDQTVAAIHVLNDQHWLVEAFAVCGSRR